ncbi:MAG: hypothetical protein D6772_12385, partial [Bacteroidetes bacterium]
LSLKNGYGFIKFPPNNLFFHYTSVVDLDFNDLLVGDLVGFVLDKNEDGQFIATNVQLLEEVPLVAAEDPEPEVEPEGKLADNEE